MIDVRNKNHLLKEILSNTSKINYGDKCLWGNCSSSAINSHSHSENILRNISHDNHVIGLNRNLLHLYQNGYFKKIGVRRASTFNGFCATHDNNLFREIESHDLNNISNKEAFLLLARSVFLTTIKNKLQSLD